VLTRWRGLQWRDRLGFSPSSPAWADWGRPLRREFWRPEGRPRCERERPQGRPLCTKT